MVVDVDFAGVVEVVALLVVFLADDFVAVVVAFAVARRTGFLRRANCVSFSLSSVGSGAFWAAIARVATMTVARMWSRCCGLVMGERARFSLQVQCLLLYTNNSRRHLDVRAHDPAGRPKSVLLPVHLAQLTLTAAWEGAVHCFFD